MNAITTVTEMLQSGALVAGEPIHRGPLSLVPLSHALPEAGYVRFGDLPEGIVTVTEVGAAGNVPELLVTNRSTRPVLFLEGEVLIGLKQDRTLNVTVMVPAHTQVHLPVACVEAGRWGHTTAYAERGGMNLPPSARFHKSSSTHRSARRTGEFRADQGEVWEAVDRELSERGIHSPSAAYREAAAAPPDPRFHEVLDLRPEPGQQGVLAVIGGRPMAADVFDRTDTLAGAWDGLIRSYVSDARRARTVGHRVTATEAIEMLAAVAAGQASEYPGVGSGSIVGVTSPESVASALVSNEAVIHLAALWSQDERRPEPQMRTRRPSRRTPWQETLGD